MIWHRKLPRQGYFHSNKNLNKSIPFGCFRAWDYRKPIHCKKGQQSNGWHSRGNQRKKRGERISFFCEMITWVFRVESLSKWENSKNFRREGELSLFYKLGIKIVRGTSKIKTVHFILLPSSTWRRARRSIATNTVDSPTTNTTRFVVILGTAVGDAVDVASSTLTRFFRIKVKSGTSGRDGKSVGVDPVLEIIVCGLNPTKATELFLMLKEGTRDWPATRRDLNIPSGTR